MLKVSSIKKSFSSPEENLLFENVSLSVGKNEWISIVGPSGAGKTTLLNCIAGIYDIDEGDIELDGQIIHDLSEQEKSSLRRLQIGFVFQDFKLLPYYSVLDNVILPLSKDQNKNELARKAVKYLEQVGIEKELHNRLPFALSRSEERRVGKECS